MYDCFGFMYVRAPMYSTYRDQERVLNPLEPELHMAVSHSVGTGNQTWITLDC